ncbi:MAG: ComEC/Rec2 family competence protein [Candidatus Paceibacterota bacterium]
MTRSNKFLFASFSFILGILFFSFWRVDLWILFLVAGLGAVGIFSSESDRNVGVFLCLTFFSLGMVRFVFYDINSQSKNSLENFIDKKVSLTGRIVEMPEIKNGKQKITINIEGSNFPDGYILVYASSYQEYFYGDRVNFEGELKIPENFDDFDYREYLLSKNVYLVSYYPDLKREASASDSFLGYIYKTRKNANENINRLLSQPEAGVLSAMTLGIKSDVSDDTLEKFNKTGVRHIIAVSGMHMVILVSLLIFVFLEVGINRNKIFYLVSFCIAIFVILSGSSSSAIRAGIMSFVVLLSLKIGRSGNSVNALVLAAVLMLAVNPRLLVSDVGFQLSFLAVAGIIFLFPYFRKKFASFPKLCGAKDIILVTLSAQIAVFPIIMENFGEFFLLSFLVNLFILPVMPLVMAGGFLLIFLSFVNFTLAQILSFLILIIIQYQLAVIDFFSRIDVGLIKL